MWNVWRFLFCGNGQIFVESRVKQLGEGEF